MTKHLKHFLPAIALIGLCATMPFNMGGCSDVTAAVGGMVGGSQGESLGRAVGHGTESMALNEKDELAMGQSVAMQVTGRYAIDADLPLNQYVVMVGLTLVDSCSKPDGNWYFAVVDDPQANAFSGPDGYIFVTTGALKEIRDESELAGVLAHEMTHVLKHHGLNAAKKSGFNSALAESGSAAVSGRDSAMGQFASTSLNAGAVAMTRGYERPQEDEADAGAVKLMSKAGYDPNGYLNFLKRLAAEQHGKNGAFSTHPDASGRVEKVGKEVAKLPQGGQTLADRYARMTAGVK